MVSLAHPQTETPYPKCGSTMLKLVHLLDGLQRRLSLRILEHHCYYSKDLTDSNVVLLFPTYMFNITSGFNLFAIDLKEGETV